MDGTGTGSARDGKWEVQAPSATIPSHSPTKRVKLHLSQISNVS